MARKIKNSWLGRSKIWFSYFKTSSTPPLPTYVSLNELWPWINYLGGLLKCRFPGHTSKVQKQNLKIGNWESASTHSPVEVLPSWLWETRNKGGESSLVASWVGSQAVTAMARVQSLVEELRSHKPSGTAEQTSPQNPKIQRRWALWLL